MSAKVEVIEQYIRDNLVVLCRELALVGAGDVPHLDALFRLVDPADTTPAGLMMAWEDMEHKIGQFAAMRLAAMGEA